MPSHFEFLAGKGPDLAELFAAVRTTAVGAGFLKIAGDEPELVWGNIENHHGNFDGEHTITLNKRERNKLSDCEWKQVLTMELGNFANREALKLVHDDAEAGDLSKEDFVDAIEQIEYKSRDAVIDAYLQGQFSLPGEACALVFPAGKLTFAEYSKIPQIVEDRAEYEEQWELHCKKKYLKKHPD
jgi:hypothetical protein